MRSVDERASVGQPPARELHRTVTWLPRLPGRRQPCRHTCPIDEPCPGPTLGDIAGVIDCIDRAGDQLVDSLLCLQFPNASACPTATPTPGAPTPTPTSTP